MKISKTFMFLAVAVLPLAWNVGYCNEDIETLKAADNGIGAGLSLGDIKEMIGNLIRGKSGSRDLPGPIPQPVWPRPEAKDITGYNQVRALFEDGTLPEEKDLTGWFSGRMFLEGRQNVANAALLVGTVTDSVVGGGPLFSAKSLKIRLFDRDDSDNYFDAMAPGQVRNYEGRLGELDRISPLTTEFRKNKLVSSWPVRYGGPSSVVQGKVVCEVRKSGDYLVVKITNTEFSVESNHIETHYAYFFRNVTP